ncbi:MAG: glycosyltransferase family 39 protein, partial [Anaerolineae bacterium]|nr:glycosyltransferase family 39 protein [Anaerolineae bacterium]
MSRLFRRLIPVVVLLGLWWIPARAAIGPTMVCGDDMLLHLLRVVQIDHLWSQGILYARLAPDMGWGFGYPVFNFYPPLSYYVALLIARLSFGIPLGVRIAQALTFLLAGLGVYSLTRDFFREEAALVAGIAAMYAPYVAYNPLYRGAMPEAMGWVLLPWAWWAVGRAVRTGRKGWFAAGTLLFGALLITHSVGAVVGTPLVSLYALMEALSRSSLPRRRRLLTAVLIVGLGLGLSLFFWIPAQAERPLVQLERVPYGFPGGYRSHFFSLGYTVFAWEPVRPDLINTYPPRSLGLVSVLLGLPGLMGLFRFPDSRRRQVAFFGAVFLLSTLMALPVSGPIWEAVPFLHNFQFPWRFLGPAALSLSVLVGTTAELLARFRWRGFAVALIVLALVLADLGWLRNVRYCPGWDRVSIESLWAYEHVGGGVGTSGGEFLPRLVQSRPPYSAGDIFEPTSLPEGAVLQMGKTGPFFAEAWVESPEPSRITVNRFHYPGWRAWVDGQEVEVTPEAGWGRLTFPVPAGRHHIVVRFGETPLRLAADVLSALSLLAMVVLALTPTPVFPAPSTGERAVTPIPVSPPPSTGEGAGGWGLLLLPLLVTAVVFLTERFQLPPVYERRLTEEGIRGVSVPMRVTYDGQFHLLGMEPIPASVPANRPVPVRL